MSDHDSHPLVSVLVHSLSPTFETTLEDIRRVHNSPMTPMVTESEITQSTSVLFSTNSEFPVQASNPGGDERTLSPVTDFELSKILNLEGTSWATEFTDCLASTIFPISPSHSASTSSDMNTSPVNGSPNNLMSPRLLPTIFQKLSAAKAPFWAAVSIDIQTCLWARVSQKLIGREPTKSLFVEVCTDAINRQTTTVSPIWEAVKVVLDVPAIVNNTNATKEMMVEHALQTKGLLHIVEAEVVTTPSDMKFILALMFSFTAAWVRYRSYCYEKAAFAVLPPAVHIRPLSPGLLPQPQDFTAAFRSKLRKLIDDHTRGWALLHENPSDVLDLPSLTAPGPPIPQQFVWFGNSVLKGVIHRALYDHTYPGWFGFLEDVRTIDGHRFWAPIHTATPRQVGQVLGWIEELMNFHIVQGNKARGPITAYAQAPDNFTAHDSVIKRVNRHTKFISTLSGGTGELLELNDKLKDGLMAVTSVANDPALKKERDICLEAYREFMRRPAHLPYNVSSFQNL